MRKDPILASLLNLLFAGTGHIYLNKIVKGVLILLLAIVFWMSSWGIANIPLIIWAMYDAYSAAKKMNRPEKTVK